MNTILKEENSKLVMYVEGRLDTPAAAQTEKDVQPLYNSEGKDIILDCTKLEYISSSGLRIFLAILKSAKSKGNQVFIRGINEDLRNVFAITGFTNLFQFM